MSPHEAIEDACLWGDFAVPKRKGVGETGICLSFLGAVHSYVGGAGPSWAGGGRPGGTCGYLSWQVQWDQKGAIRTKLCGSPRFSWTRCLRGRTLLCAGWAPGAVGGASLGLGTCLGEEVRNW